MNIKLKFKKNILIGLIVAFIPASLNAAWYDNVVTSFKENLVAIASVAVGGTALLGTLWYMKNRAQNKEKPKSTPPKKKVVIDDQTALQAELKEAKDQIGFLQDEQTALNAENKRLRQECQRIAQTHPQIIHQSPPAPCASCAGHTETIQRCKNAIKSVLGERATLQTQLTQSQRAHQDLQTSFQTEIQHALAQQAQQHQSALDTAHRNALMLEKENAAAQRTLAYGQKEMTDLKAENSRLKQAMNETKRKAQADIEPLLAKIAHLEAMRDRTKAALETTQKQFTQQAAVYEKTITQLTQLQNKELELYEKRSAQRTADLQANHNALITKYNALLKTNSSEKPAVACAGGAAAPNPQPSAAVRLARPNPNSVAAAAHAPAGRGASKPQPAPIQDPFARLSE